MTPPIQQFFSAALVASSPAITVRSDKCAAPGLQSCASQGLSAAFCCEANSRCLPLAGNSTVICCPKDSSCDAIRPITCNVAAQNPDEDVHAPIKTLALTSTLPKCGTSDACCPFGFTCSDDGKLCKKDQDQSRLPDGFTPSATSIATAAPSATSTEPAPAASSATSAPHDDESAAISSKVPLIGGIAGGALALIILALVFLCCLRRRRRRTDKAKDKGYKPQGNIISHPIMGPEGVLRTDFARKPSVSGTTLERSLTGSTTSRAPRIDYEPPTEKLSNRATSYYGSPTDSILPVSPMSTHEDGRVRLGDVGAAKPTAVRSEPGQRIVSHRPIYSVADHRLFSSESSSEPFGQTVFDNIDLGDDSRNTTFGAMMNKAKVVEDHRGSRHAPGNCF